MKYEVIKNIDNVIGNPLPAEQELINEVVNDVNNSIQKTNSGSNGMNNNSQNSIGQNQNNFQNQEGNLNNNNQNKHLENYNSNNQLQNMELVNPTRKFHYKLQQLSTFTKDLSILVRCMRRTDKKTFKTNKGSDFTVFNFVVMDSENTEMQISCFGKIAEKFFPLIREGRMYEIIGGYVKVNDRKFNNTNADYQINLNDESTIKCIIDNGDICDINPQLTCLSKLNDMKVYSNIDFVALVINATERNRIKTKKGEMDIKKLVIVDDSEYKVDFTLWKNLAEIDIKIGDIILVKKAKVGEYNGRNITASDDSVINVNPTFKSIHGKIAILKNMMNSTHSNNNKLHEEKEDQENENKNNYASPGVNSIDIDMEFGGNKSASKNDSNLQSNQKLEFKNFKTYQSEKIQQAKSLYECKISNLKEAFNDQNEKSHKVKVYITQFNHGDKNYYAGCPKCKKKLIESHPNSNEIEFKCNTCNEIVSKPYYFFTISFRVKDSSADQFIDCFGQLAEKILGVTG